MLTSLTPAVSTCSQHTGGVTSTPASRLPPVFDKLAPLDHQELLNGTTLECYPKGYTIQREGDHAASIWITVAGWGTLSIRGSVVGLAGGGRFYTPGFAPTAVNATTFVATSAMQLLRFDRELALAVLLRCPEVLVQIIDVSILRVIDYQILLRHLGLPKLEHRIAAAMWTLGMPLADGGRLIPGAVPQSTFAGLLQVSREEFNKKRKFLVQGGHLVAREKDWWVNPTVHILLG